MNWIACFTTGRRTDRPRRHLLLASMVLLACAGCGASTEGTAAPTDPLAYEIDYVLRPEPSEGVVDVTLRVTQPRALLRELRFASDPRLTDLDGDGELTSSDGVVTWYPPADGGTLQWRVTVASRRSSGAFDAWLGPDWGLFRAEDVIPRAATRTLKGAHSETWLELSLPAGWSGVTEYFGNAGRFRVDKPSRRFDQPTGWLVVGKLGVRRETILGTRVAIAGPVGESIRRMDILALLHWTLPELARILPELPERLTIVSAGDPMWRGALSAPQSLYVHADRPLISENATSTILHELMHVSLAITAARGYDWIPEGLAEYYSLELLRRSGSISARRYERAMADLADWATQANSLCAATSTGATTAMAVTIFKEMDREIRKRSDAVAGLDDVVHRLWHHSGYMDLARLSAIVEQVAGGGLDVLQDDRLPGCQSFDPSTQTD